MWIAVIAVGLGLGFAIRPVIQNLQEGGTTGAGEATATVRCAGPEGSELALSEAVQAGLQTSGTPGAPVTYQRNYRLERPGQPALAFEAGGDASNAPLNCANVRFGPGPRVTFGRGPEAVVIELVGPYVRRYSVSQNADIVKLVADQRWKLQLKLSDYSATAPMLGEDGKNGRWTLERVNAAAGLPSRLVFNTNDGGASWTFNQSESLAGL